MKRRLIFLVSFFSSLSLFAQHKIRFMCNGSGVPNLGFQLTACDKTNGYTTNTEGAATFTIPDGCTNFRIQFQDITYGSFDSIFSVLPSTKEYLIQLTEKQTTIDEVRVAGYVSNIKENARGREYKINTSKFEAYTPIPKALQRLPEFVRSGESVVIAGKTGSPTYYLDDKEVSETVLQTLNIQVVDRVEVREVSANPSKDGGEIRIYRKKSSLLHLNGNVSLSGRYELNNDKRIGYSTAPSLSFQSPRFDASASGRYIREERVQQEYEIFSRTGLADSISKTRTQESPIDGNANLYMSYLFSKSFSAQIEGIITTYNETDYKTSFLDKDYRKRAHYDELVGNGILVLRYEYNDNNIFKINGSYGYINDASVINELDWKDDLKQNNYTAAGEFSGTHNDLFTLWSLTHSIDYAYRYIMRGGSTGSSLSPKSHTQRVLLEDFIEFPFNISLFLGCAVDYDIYDYGIQHHKFWNVLPTTSLSYGNKWGRLSFSYSQRVQKPNLAYVDPRIRYTDRRMGTIGNQALLPAMTHSYSLRYSKRIPGHSFSFRVEYLDVHNYVSSLYENDNFVSKFHNVGTFQRIAPRISYQGDYFDGKLYINVYGGVNYSEYAFYATYAARSLGKAQKGWNTVANISIEYSPISPLTIETWLGHWGRGYNLYGYYEPVSDLGASVDYRLLKDKSLKLHVSAGNLLSMTLKTNSLRELYSFKEMSESQAYPTIMLGVEYRFGKYFRSRRMDGIEIDDELDRIR